MLIIIIQGIISMSELPLIISFSGGRTSAFMSLFLKKYYENSNRELHFIFANTGKEREETLEFVNKCSKEFDLNVIWLEYDLKINLQQAFRTHDGIEFEHFREIIGQYVPIEKSLTKDGCILVKKHYKQLLMDFNKSVENFNK